MAHNPSQRRGDVASILQRMETARHLESLAQPPLKPVLCECGKLGRWVRAGWEGRRYYCEDCAPGGVERNPQRPPRAPQTGPTTLGELVSLKSCNWVWAYCASPGGTCGHHSAIALVPFLIRWGPDVSFDWIREGIRCSLCKKKGSVSIIMPSSGWAERGFPVGDIQAAPRYRWPMCNLYSQTKGQQAIRELARAMRDLTGNLPPLPAIFPDRAAPIVRNTHEGVRELTMARWGFPPPMIPGQKPRNPFLTNIRKTDSRYWQPWLKKPEHRCLVPATSFSEPDWRTGKCEWTWFAQDESRPLMFFAGVWRDYEGERGPKSKPEPGPHLLYSFLTTDASEDVKAVHEDATPVLLLDEAAREQWMNAPWEEARELQKPPPAGALKIVAVGKKEDGG